ncbi:MAG: hypothetical protein ACD_71C00097G0007 [uncultured bacterium (gcode 4)]|uniref:Radical SAM core domain-containing protein n=1 Tax=uncultured bacterium (gcode 4) TaxID=1234023 RepID=K1Z5S3_9BACT|nr:MAG: hypothetical protein ACD_71C00097G0007 [uncultured bacterium (gcode 4)]
MKNFSRLEEIWSVRLKITDDCVWSCKFCHNEWDIGAETLVWNGDLENKFITLREIFWIREVHLTGWEPSLNKDIGNIISWLKKIWMDVKMTSNGQFSEETRNVIVNSWIDAVNFSVQSMNPIDLQSVMKRNVSETWANEQIERWKENIIALYSRGIKVRINSVLWTLEDLPRIQKIINWAIENNVEMRVLDDLNQKENAKKAIEELILRVWGKLKEIINTSGTSSKRLIYELPNQGLFTIKQIAEVYLSGICEECPHFEWNSCQEGFYSIRMQKNKKDGEYSIILCIQNQNSETIIPFDDFLQSYYLKKYEHITLARWN